MNYNQKFDAINRCRSQSTGERIASELSYLNAISQARGGIYRERIEQALDTLIARLDRDGVITSSTVREVEESLSDLAPVAKSLTMLFQAHAHIDMNWKWGYNETAAITIDTFRTVLDIMREYPDMTFMQSQASTYEIVEKFCPEMLPEIKERIREGRWEVNAAEWVEPDKNMPDGESQTRQILQAKKYLAKLLEIDPDSLDLDFVPDTFGHNLNAPEILSDAGVKYMYHCRAHNGPNLYKYVSPSGKSVLTYCDFTWYNNYVSPHMFELIPANCEREKLDTFLYIYGVGDHGGGPSRRDVSRITEYMSWPLTPTIRFGTMHEFFRAVERCRSEFPEINTERNFVFSGCYTTQTRIKMANRLSEVRMNETEALSASASILADAPREPERLDNAWRMLLFNHFHDILPGSGKVETREFALGRYQETMAVAGTYGSMSMRRIAEAIDTSALPFVEQADSYAEGGGVGFYQDAERSSRFPSPERGCGPFRAFHLFNPSGFDRSEVTEVTVWDYPADFGKAFMEDADGNGIPFAVIDSGEYWSHNYTKIMFPVKVPAFGYTTVKLRQMEEGEGHIAWPFSGFDGLYNSVIQNDPIILENDLITAVFDKKTCRLMSLIDKETGEKLIDKPSCFFRYGEENPLYGMTAWRIGPFMKTVDLNEANSPRFTDYRRSALYDRFSYTWKFGRSILDCTVMLKRDSRVLEFNLRIDWSEDFDYGKMVPQLAFAVPVSYGTTGTYHCDIPYGELLRKAAPHDVPALSHITVDGEGKHVVSLICDTKYGYQLDSDTATVTIVRSAYEPDLYPDRGIHNVRIGVFAGEPDEVRKNSSVFCRPLPFISGTRHGGSLPLSGVSMTVISGSAEVSCLKNSEDGTGAAVRLTETAGVSGKVSVRFARPVSEAFVTNSLEKPVSPAAVSSDTVTVDLKAYETSTFVVRFK